MVAERLSCAYGRPEEEDQTLGQHVAAEEKWHGDGQREDTRVA